MRLTKRGGDYLKAAIATTIMSSILDLRITLAISLSLVIAALISQLLLATASGRNIRIEIEKSHLTVFKEEEAIENIRIISRRRRFIMVEVASVKGPQGVEAGVASQTPDAIAFSFRPAYAGRFQGLTVTFDLKDTMQLFHKTMKLSRPDFTIDSLPKSLTVDIKAARPMSLTLGERTGRTHGFGQEFYALDEYSYQSEKRDILWKKVAEMTDERLIVKVRESNIPKTLKIGMIRLEPRESEASIRWMDRACEGAGLLGRILFLIGCDVELLYSGEEGRVAISHAAELTELSSSIMEMSMSGTTEGEQVASILGDSDICITGLKELEQELFSLAVSRKPTLVIAEPNAVPWSIGDLSVLFTGTEDVNRLVNAVIGK